MNCQLHILCVSKVHFWNGWSYRLLLKTHHSFGINAGSSAWPIIQHFYFFIMYGSQEVEHVKYEFTYVLMEVWPYKSLSNELSLSLRVIVTQSLILILDVFATCNQSSTNYCSGKTSETWQVTVINVSKTWNRPIPRGHTVARTVAMKDQSI